MTGPPIIGLRESGLANISQPQVNDSFEYLSDGDNPPTDTYINTLSATATITRAFNGNIGLKLTHGINEGLQAENLTITSNTIEVYYNESTQNSDFAFGLWNSSNEKICYVGSNNPDPRVSDGDGQSDFTNPSPLYDEWRKFVITLNYSTNSLRYDYIDLTGTTPDQAKSGRSMENNASQISRLGFTGSHGWAGGGGATDVWTDLFPQTA